jgi:hypothetical protein
LGDAMGSCRSDHEGRICIEGALGPEFAGFRVRVCGDSCDELTKLISDCAIKTIDTLKLFGKFIGRHIGKLFIFRARKRIRFNLFRKTKHD